MPDEYDKTVRDNKIGRARSELSQAVRDLMDLVKDEEEVEDEVETALSEWHQSQDD